MNIKKLLQHSDKSFQVHNTLLQLWCLAELVWNLNQNLDDISRQNELKRHINKTLGGVLQSSYIKFQELENHCIIKSVWINVIGIVLLFYIILF